MTRQNQLRALLNDKVRDGEYLFSLPDIAGAFPELSYNSLKSFVARAVSSGIVKRICKGIYFYKVSAVDKGTRLYRVAALLRSDSFNYVSLETVLSGEGIISQLPMNWITLMSSGRSYTYSCGDWGTIEFIHTDKKPNDLIDHIQYDSTINMWKADSLLALRDLNRTGRNRDLIQEGVS